MIKLDHPKYSYTAYTKNHADWKHYTFASQLGAQVDRQLDSTCPSGNSKSREYRVNECLVLEVKDAQVIS